MEQKIMEHRVICVNKTRGVLASCEHITNLGLGDESGYYQRITVDEVLRQIRNPFGDRYYTVSPTTGARAEVIEGQCEVCGGRPYVRTTADGIRDNNLNSLTLCRVA
jgi:hypothetical protein